MARNSAILSIYVGASSLVDSGYGMSPVYIPPDSNPLSTPRSGPSTMEVAQDTLVAVQSSHEGDYTMGESIGLESHPYRLNVRD